VQTVAADRTRGRRAPQGNAAQRMEEDEAGRGKEHGQK